MPAADTTSVTRTLLLADGNDTIRRVVELTFADQNVRVVPVSDGTAAIEAIRRSPPDLVLADIAMPGQSGYDVATFVRSQPGLSTVPVLLLAGAFEAVDQARARGAGVAGVLSKPFDPAVLVARVRELLAPRTAQSTTAPTASSSGVTESSTAATESATAEAERSRGPTESAAAAVESTAAVTAPEAPTTEAAVRAASERDRYFAELDQAFATLSQNPRPPLPVHDDAPPAVPLTDAFAAILEAERTGAPLEAVWPAGAAADAHAASAAAQAAAPETDDGGEAAAAAPPIDIERLADLVAQRVLAQLTDRVVRETVGGIVSTTAERLVREEIDRIKRHIK